MGYNKSMQIMEPVVDLEGSLWHAFPKRSFESGQPQELHDGPEQLAQMLGRQRVTYEPVWQAVAKSPGMWVPVLCNSYRRALLLASSAMQHRTRAYDVWRRGRLVCIRQIMAPDVQQEDRAISA